MYIKPQSNKKAPHVVQKNTHETASESFDTLSGFGSSVVKNTVNEFKDIGEGVFDQLFGSYEEEHTEQSHAAQEQPRKKAESNIFSFNSYHEREVVAREIKQLTEEIRKTVAAIQNESSELVKDAAKLAMQPVSEKPGIYHVRLLEVILSLLRQLRMKIGESRTWMDALVSKKKKRGSAFAVQSKKSGTQYSMSQELSNARSVQ